MDFRALGPVEVVYDGVSLPITGTLRRTLLAVLIARVGEPVSVDTLLEAMWPGEPHQAHTGRLQVQVSRIRRLLEGPDRISFAGDSYLLHATEDEVDIQRFERLADEAAGAQDPDERADTARKALALWRGRPFDGRDVPVLADETQRLDERRRATIELLYDAELRRGRHREIVAELTDLTARYPLNERLAALLMTALYRCGRQAEALAAYRTARRALVDELGLEPGPELRAAEQEVLSGRIQTTPNQLPFLVRGFVGRDTEIAQLDSWLTGTTRVFVLSGTAGVGKTALAVRWAHSVRDRFPDGQLYVDLRGFGPDEPRTPADALAGFLRALGIADIPAAQSERAARFRTVTDGQKLLILLDNARSAEHVRALLPGGVSCLVLITSRAELTGLSVRDGARRIDLNRLSAQDARRLLHELIGDQTDPSAVDALIDRCARLPLALRIAAELVDLRRGASLADLVTELSAAQDRLDTFDVDDAQTSIRSVFSWSYHHLPEPAARLFRLCGLNPRPDADRYALAALAGADLREVRRALDPLVRANLVERAADGRVHLHDLLRAYAAELCQETDPAEARDAALTRLFDMYQHSAAAAMRVLAPNELYPPQPQPEVTTPAPAFDGYADALRWLDAERANLVGVAVFAVGRGFPRVTTHLSATLFRYLDSGYQDDALALHQNALNAARALGDRLAEAHATRLVGFVHTRIGDNETALGYALCADGIYRELGLRGYQRAQRMNVGWVQIGLGRYLEALDSFATSLELYRGPDDPDPSGCAAALAGIGDGNLRLGRLEEAGRALREGVELAMAVPDARREALNRMYLGMVYERLGELELAAANLERAREIDEQVGSRVAQAQMYRLGPVYWRLGRRADAFEVVWHCIGLARQGRHPVEESGALNVLGELHRLDGTPAEAITYHRDALTISAESGERHEQAHAHAGLGDAYAAVGDLDQATTHWQAALASYRDLGVAEAAEIAARLHESAT